MLLSFYLKLMIFTVVGVVIFPLVWYGTGTGTCNPQKIHYGRIFCRVVDPKPYCICNPDPGSGSRGKKIK
jgi:hypothetical protein